jgi:S-DNA-T family DNA segregation ATPase FtsK/SpoIIIE
VLLLSSNAGSIGQFVSEGMQQAFGRGSVVIPLLFMVVGGLILWQERIVDAPISGSNVFGVVLLAVVALAMLEPKQANPYVVPPLGTGGGVVGGVLNQALIGAFGVAGAWTLLILLFIFAVLLTFNVTLRQFLQALRGAAGWVGHMFFAQHGAERTQDQQQDDLAVEPVPFANELPKPKRGSRPAEPPTKPAPAASAQLQQDLILTPIAERPTQPGLFDRSRQRAMAAADAPATPIPAQALLANADTQRIEIKPTKEAEPTAKRAKEPPPPPEEEVADLDTGGVRQIWPRPPLDLLDNYSEGEVDDNEKRSKARIIEDTLASFKIEAQVVGMNPGPAVTQYQLQPAVGVRVNRITALEKDLALALAAPAVRIEAPIPGTSYIGIEVPNSMIASVSLREVIDTDEFNLHKGVLKLALGKDVSGAPVVTDLTRAPHLLIAGSTGSGKSAAINSILTTLLMQHAPDELKFIMIDPKMVEMIVYNHIPHLLAPVVTELERVVSLLKWAVKEMERRYKLLAQKGFRNIASFNKEARKRADLEPLPYIVIIVDELADLMMLAPDEVETLVCRLAQMARAIGIHLILATQRPSVDVVTGLIKANFPTRMAFAVTQQIDSRVILDTNGAEQLLGRGDMLYLASDAPKPIRVQGTYASDREIERIVNFWRAAQKPEDGAPKKPVSAGVPLRPPAPEEAAASRTAETTAASRTNSRTNGGAATGQSDEAIPERDESLVAVSPLPSSSAGSLTPEEQDELLPQAIRLVRQHERASASLLQRRLRIGYSKAAQLIDLLEQQGIVGPAEGGRSREVLSEEDAPL